MVYVKFTGKTLFPKTEYSHYLTFNEEDANSERLCRESIDFAIENARIYDNLLTLTGDWSKDNFLYLDYLQESIAAAEFFIISQEEFERAIENYFIPF